MNKEIKIDVTYHKKSTAAVVHRATFDNVEDAQLFWDSILYLRNIYAVLSPRPS